MAVDFQDIEEKCIKEIERDNLDYFTEHLDNIFTVNSVLRSKDKIWDTNALSVLGILVMNVSKLNNQDFNFK